MFKINVTDRFKNLHEQYFSKNIIARLRNKKITFDSTDIINLRDNYGINNIQAIHDDFIDYCINNANRISVGDYSELKKVNDEIESNYPLIIELINNKNFKFNSSNKMYWQSLFDIFGYDDFCKCELYEVILQIAMNYTNILKLNKDKDKCIVEIQFITILEKLFPGLKSQIDNEFDEIIKGNVFKKDDFKIMFNEFADKYSLEFTINNYKNMNLYGVWNAYLFVYEIELRTCPYCNRQYITPVLTSTGKMRATLDHFLPKNRYPYFSMSLYNLIPACYNCNSSLKGDNDFNTEDINPYEESMDDYIEFFADLRIDKQMKVNVIHKNIHKLREVDKYIGMFKLNEQYNYHANQVEELVLKRYMYSDEYIKDIKEKILYKFNISEKQIKEQIIGYTEDNMKINDEPLSKFRRDMVNQLWFFDDYDLYLVNKLQDILDNK